MTDENFIKIDEIFMDVDEIFIDVDEIFIDCVTNLIICDRNRSVYDTNRSAAIAFQWPDGQKSMWALVPFAHQCMPARKVKMACW